MMYRTQAAWALLALTGFHAIGVMADPACVGKCINESRDGFSKYGCTAANEVGCLCKSSQFVNAIKGCTDGCGGGSADEIRGALTAPGAFTCEQFANELPAPDGASSSAAPSPTAASTSPASSPTAASTSSTTSPPPSTSSQPTATSSPTSTPTTLASSTSSPATISSPSSTTSGTATSSSTGTSTTAASETSASSTSSSVPDAAGGISSGAAAGIGIGVAIVVVAVAAIAFCLYRKRKSQAPPRHSMEISKPLPGSGRTYPTRDHDRDSFDKYNNDIEMTANRYEDMVPSQQPRTMV